MTSGVESADFAYFPERQQYSFHMYLIGAETPMTFPVMRDLMAQPATDSVDLIDEALRIVNGTLAGLEDKVYSTDTCCSKTEFGQLSSVGRLEVKNGGVWGTVWYELPLLSSARSVEMTLQPQRRFSNIFAWSSSKSVPRTWLALVYVPCHTTFVW